ncbi:MAG: 23S rRNA (pseudouridine(1915)-N(3))-methyltransferase RlmH [Clostridiales bacterium]|nr:23S rRNA (pseudouridine(1915)-N(3))-methyltransferase RlmH [Clostridiales bacterium]
MLHVTVLCVGGLKECYWRDACAEYKKRLGAFCRIDVVEIEEAPAPKKASDAQLKAVVDAEGKRILQKIPASAAVVAMCIEGKTLDSPELADRLSRMTVDGVSEVVFVIGGSWGLADEVKGRAALRLSMSRMTFPHQLARVMLLEQIYRAFQISSRGKYHK